MNRHCKNILAQMMGRMAMPEIPEGTPPELVERIEEWPDLINSIVDTGRKNFLIGDAAAYINTNIVFNASNYASFRLEMDAIHPFTHYTWNIHGIANNPSFFVGFSNDRKFAYGNGTTEVETILASEHVGKELIFSLDFSVGTYTVTDASSLVQLLSRSFTPVKPSKQGRLSIFRWYPSGSPFEAHVNRVSIYVDGSQHTLVPFRNSSGECGLLDLFDMSFYTNANIKGMFTIVTM